MITIYHNPRCSKSRQTLALLEQSALEFKIIEYLKEPISTSVLTKAFESLGMNLIRTKDQAFKDLNVESISEKDIVGLIDESPKLLERPLIVKDDKYMIARPPESVLEFLNIND